MWYNRDISPIVSLLTIWAGGVFFLLRGLGNLAKSPLVGLCQIAVAAFLLPPVRNFVYSKTNRTLSVKVRLFSIIVLFIAAGGFIILTESRQDRKNAEEAAQKNKEEKVRDASPKVSTREISKNYSEAPQIVTPKFGLNWGAFSKYPAKDKIEKSYVLDSYDVLVLYYGLSKKRYPVEEFSNYFPGYEYDNEFEKQRLDSKIKMNINEKYKKIISTTLCVASNAQIEDYNFERKGFPVKYGGMSIWDIEGRWFARFIDSSRSATSFCTLMKNTSDVEIKVYLALAIDNLKDKNIFPSFINMDESGAEKISKELKYYEMPELKEGLERIGEGGDYRKYSFKTALLFILFKPKLATNVDVAQEGVRYKEKEVVGEGVLAIFATTKGTVFGVYPLLD